VAELSRLQEQLAEVLGLALAAPVVLDRVEERDDGADVDALRREAREVQARCAAIAEAWGGELRWDVLSHAAYVDRKAGELLKAWVKAGTDAVQRWEFLAMAEAGELAATAALGALNRGGERAIEELVDYALPVQERHLQAALDGCARIAAGALAEPETAA
jgi:hypothetical protein